MHSAEPLVAPESTYYNHVSGQLAQTYFLYPVCAGDFIYQPGYSLTRASFDSWLLEVILSGSLEIQADGAIYQAQAGDTVLLDCHRPHGYHSDQGWHALWVHFDGAPAAGYASLILSQSGPVLHSTAFTDVRYALQSIHERLAKPTSDSDARLALLLTKALTSLASSASAANFRDEQRTAIEAVITRINQAPEQAPSISEMARMASMSEYYFIRVFRQMIGVTPRQYLIAARMNQARYLLATTSLTVSEIAQRVGYASESMFCQTFKKTQHITPSEYRTDREELK
ncbi:MAG: AraC family transcriptional regulator [Clostridia bacterium]|nr:AraC family transcriptional regulator [Clostridia bacterium]